MKYPASGIFLQALSVTVNLCIVKRKQKKQISTESVTGTFFCLDTGINL